MDRDWVKAGTRTLILSVLSRGPQHGYQMVKELERLSSGVFTLKEGTLYPLLHTLEQDGLLVARWETQEGRERKVYELTDAGRGELQRRTAEWTAMRQAMDKVLGTGVHSYARG